MAAAKQALANAEEEEEAAQMAAAVAQDDYEASVQTATVATAAIPDRTALRARMVEREAHARQAVENQRYAEAVAHANDRQAEADRLTSEIAKLDTAKAEMLIKATFPLEGLGLDDKGVTWQGLPFAQASSAIRTRVSVAIGAALNPKLKVLLVRGGNDLDGKNLALLAETAKEHDIQVWLERIAGGDGQATVLIEDGTVARETVATR